MNAMDAVLLACIDSVWHHHIVARARSGETVWTRWNTGETLRHDPDPERLGRWLPSRREEPPVGLDWQAAR